MTDRRPSADMQFNPLGTSPLTNKMPLRWNRAAQLVGIRCRVALLADLFEDAADPAWRTAFWQVIRATPYLDWQVATEQPQNIARMLPPDWQTRDDGKWQPHYPNVWLGTQVGTKQDAEQRLPHLIGVQAQVHFVLAEPLLEHVNLDRLWVGEEGLMLNALSGFYTYTGSGGIRGYAEALDKVPTPIGQKVGWVVVGGECGTRARPMQQRWAQSILAQCHVEGVPVYFKQAGSRPGPDWPPGLTGRGDNPVEWPFELRKQEFPYL